jgi:lipopolysaccharide export system protein LptA
VKYFNDYQGKVNAQSITGLGDRAYYDGYASVSVLKGDAYVRIAVDIATNLKPEEKLAAEAVPNM